MFYFFSKLLPLFFYPAGLTILLILIALRLQSRKRWQTAVLVSALAVIFLGGNKWVTTAIMRPLEWRYLPPDPLPEAPVIVLLGGGTRSLDYPQGPVPGLNEAGERLLYSSWLYQQGVAPNILISGGQSVGSSTGETVEMAWALSLMGVPEEVMWFEDRSLNTYENGLYARELLSAKEIQEIVLVTSAVHMPRAVAIFEKQGFTVIPAPTDYFVVRQEKGSLPAGSPAFFLIDLIPDAENLHMTTRALKEYMGFVVYWLRGWL